ncbi:MAG: hypothetical protein KJO47_08515 [Gammaproteobacteria bacterium]|nr:hypothetical protein [Gammaproteobacteria bacterium]NNC67666.1 hypothetical protein [Gammaproteobacteria bacterium]
MMKNLAPINNSLLTRIILLVVVSIFLNLIAQKHLNAEETEKEIEKIDLSTISWGRKYFFDAPRFKDDNIREQLDAAIEEKFKTYGIKLTEGNSSSKYVLNYTLVLEESASQQEIEELYIQEPELTDSSDGEINIEQGEFLISIRNRDTRMAIWRNNIEGLAILEVPDEIRQKRVKTIIDQAFMTFPKEYKYSQ